MTTTFYRDTMPDPPLLLKRTDFVDEAFLAGAWEPTKLIIDYMAGNNDFVEEIPEAAAKSLAPNAF